MNTSKLITLLFGCFAASLVAAANEPPALEHIKQVDLIHFTHTDFGFTDHPSVVRDLQRRYLDVALDAVEKTRSLPEAARFHWTAEGTVAVDDWWKTASRARREQFLQAVRDGQIEVTALACNNTAYLDRDEWRVMTHWLPDDLWRKFNPQTAVQDDVNGFPRAGAKAILDRGIRYLFSGLNSDNGGPPLPRMTAFWWKQPDGQRLFVWLGQSYSWGIFLFERTEWRRGPVPRAANTAFRPPRAGEILNASEASVRAAHKLCIERLRGFERRGYHYSVVPISLTSMWRGDNDPPFPPLSDFVAEWNRLGLKPRLKLVTVTEAMKDLEKVAGSTAPEYKGEWTDWWANGPVCAPREMAASRAAERNLAAIQSPVWGPLSASASNRVWDLTKELCLFDEHSFGSSMCVAAPYSFDTQGQWNEKARLAWRPWALSDYLLSQRVRSRLVGEGEGLFVANPTPAKFSGWVQFNSAALRGNFKSLVDTATGDRIPLEFLPGVQPWGRPNKNNVSRENAPEVFPDKAPGRLARFWVEGLDASAIKRFRLSTNEIPEAATTNEGPSVSVDENGWPLSATWPGMKKPLFTAGIGDFISVDIKGFAGRQTLRNIENTRDRTKRDQLRKEMFKRVAAVPEGPAKVEETPHTICYKQWLKHPRLGWAVRKLELWKDEPRARLTVSFDRLSSFVPETFYIVTPMPCDGVLPRLSCGGEPFIPFKDQLGSSCRDYFAVDGWANYVTPNGDWLWVSRDAPLITFDEPQQLARRREPPPRTGCVLAMVYDNFWYTNFLGDEPGEMEFQFDLVWRPKAVSDAEAGSLSQTLSSNLKVLINPACPENPIIIKRLYEP